MLRQACLEGGPCCTTYCCRRQLERAGSFPDAYIAGLDPVPSDPTVPPQGWWRRNFERVFYRSSPDGMVLGLRIPHKVDHRLQRVCKLLNLARIFRCELVSQSLHLFDECILLLKSTSPLDIYSPVPVPSEFPSCVRESLVR